MTIQHSLKVYNVSYQSAIKIKLLFEEIFMGVGNFTLNNAETLYLDHEAVYGDYTAEDCWEHETDSYTYYEELIYTLKTLLPKSYNTDIIKCDKFGSIIAENSFYRVSVVDWEGYFAINVILKDDFKFESKVHPLAEANHIRASTSFFDKIAELYPDHVRQRSSAWTTCTYIHSKDF